MVARWLSWAKLEGGWLLHPNARAAGSQSKKNTCPRMESLKLQISRNYQGCHLFGCMTSQPMGMVRQDPASQRSISKDYIHQTHWETKKDEWLSTSLINRSNQYSILEQHDITSSCLQLRVWNTCLFIHIWNSQWVQVGLLNGLINRPEIRRESLLRVRLDNELCWLSQFYLFDKEK